MMLRSALWAAILVWALIFAGIAFETFFVRLYLLGEFSLGDLFRAMIELSGAGYAIYQLHIGEQQ